MSRKQPITEQQWYVGGLAVIAIVVAVFVIMAATAAAFVTDTIIEVPSATRYGSGHVFEAPTGHDGETCNVVLAETNEMQPSSNPGNYLTLTTGDVYLVLDIETGRGGFSKTSVVGVVGPTATLTWHIGRVSSAGAAVSLECEPEVPPSTTTTTETPVTTTAPVTTSTTVPASSTTTTLPDVTTTTSSVPPVTSPTTPPSPTTTTSTTQPTPEIPSGVPTGVG